MIAGIRRQDNLRAAAVSPLSAAPPAGAAAPPCRAGFTLIELLVVIAILTLLVAMLMPVLARAREIARTAVCSSNLKAIGNAEHMFAAAHQSRFTGYADAGPYTNGAGYYRYYWSDFLNYEQFGSRRVQSSGPTPIPNLLYCPSDEPYGSLNSSSFAYQPTNVMAGDPYYLGPFEGRSGKRIDPPPAPPRSTLPGCSIVPGTWGQYALGSDTSMYKSPSQSYLFIEGEKYMMSKASGTNTSPYSVQVGMVSTTTGSTPYLAPPWAGPPGSGGLYSFRHLRPRDVSRYQGEAYMNILFADSHVNRFNPSNPVDKSSKFTFDP